MLIVLLVYVLLWLPPVQQKIKDVALREVMQKTRSTISIGELHLRPFNSIYLKDVYAADQKNDTLLYVHSLRAGFDLFRLFDNHLLINTVELDDVFVNLNKEHPDSVFNFQFMIDAFSSPADTTKQDEPSSLIIEIDKVSLKNARVNYDILSEPLLAEDVFDFNHISLKKLDLELNLPSIDMENLDVSLNQLHLEETKGFILSDLKLKVRSEDSVIKLNDLQLKLPQSDMQGNATINYAGMELSEILSGAEYTLTLSSDAFHAGDIRCFYPGIGLFSEGLSFHTEMKGEFPAIHLPVLEIDYGKALELKANVDLADINRWKSASFSLNMERLYLTNSLVSQILQFTSGETTSLPIKADALTANAVISGSLPDFAVRLDAHTEHGSCNLTGNAGLLENGAIHFDLDLQTPGFNLGELTGDTIMGIADLNLDAKGGISEAGVMNASASVKINRFDFNSYIYSNIEATGFYRGDSIHAKIISNDSNLPIELTASANIGKRNPSADMYAKLSEIHLDSLNLFPNYPESEISMIFRANAKGFDPERMKADIFIDSLYVQTQSGSYDDNGIRATYLAEDNSRKELNVDSKILNIISRGQYTYSGIENAVKQAFPVLFAEKKTCPKNVSTDNSINENFNLVFQIRRSNAILPLLGINAEIPDSALLVMRYNNEGQQLDLDATAFCIFDETDTLKLSVDLANIENNLNVLFGVNNRSSRLNVNGSLNAEVEFIPLPGAAIPDMDIHIKPSSVKINDVKFKVRPAHLSITDKRYEINDFAFEHSLTEYLRIDGIISEEAGDSVILSVNDFQIATILAAMNMDFPLSAVASGNIQASRILTTPLVKTRGFAIDSIIFAGNSIGDLSLTSGWSAARQGIALRAALSGDDIPESVIQGFYLPTQDSLTLIGDIQGLKLAWLQNFMEETLFGLDGSVGAKFKVSGFTSNPQLQGNIYFDQARLGVKKLNTMYSITDSIRIEPNALNFRRFTIQDSDNKTAVINGRVNHQQFAQISPNLKLTLDNFRIMDNETHTDSLFYGNMQLSGSLSLQLQNNDWVLSGNLAHARNNKVTVNMPSSPTEARRYNSVTFVNSDGEDLDLLAKADAAKSSPAFTLPLRINNLSFAVNSGLDLAVVYNPSTRDKAMVSGTGNVFFSYDMKSADMSLLGNYEIEEGNLTLSLPNITRKTFTMQENSELTFKGDPLKTGFDITAIYSLRANLETLDSSFSEVVANTNVNVQCLLTISGDLDNIVLSYDINLPNQSDDVQRKLEGLLYTDDIKIKQIAYLLAFGSFMPPGDNIGGGEGNIWTSLASSSITHQLNNLLSSVLSENWSIGTDIHSNDANFSQVEMDVNVSTHLFNDRLTINTTLGYTNDMTQRQNFTGDFDFEYKLTPNGNILLRFYNMTNNSYQDRAPMTQGVGVLYRREGKTFNQLFRSFRTKRQQPHQTEPDEK